MTAQYRATDGPRQGRFWVWMRRLYRVWVALVPAVAVAAAFIAVVQTRDTVEDVAEIQRQQAAERAENRHQTCVAFERDTEEAVDAYQDAVRAYERTVVYLARVPVGERETLFTRTIRQGLPRLRTEVHQHYDDAKAAAAPAYCDEPGVGLDEPNPDLPDEPLP